MNNPSDKLTLAVSAITAETILDQGKHDYYQTTETGITFEPETPFEIWERIGETIAHVYQSSKKLNSRAALLLGDVCVFGESAFGEQYSQLIDATRTELGWKPKTLANAMWVAKNIPPSRRRETLSLAHHSEVAALSPDEQVEFLGKSADENLSLSELKKEVKARHPKTAHGKERATPPKKAIIDLESEEGLAHAAEKIAEWFQAEEKEIKADKKRTLFKDWPVTRKNLWMSLGELARYARNMGLTGQDKARRS